MPLQQPFLEALLLEYERLRGLLTGLSRELDHATGQTSGPLDGAHARLLLERLRQVNIPHHIRELHGLFARIGQRCPPLAPVLLRMEHEHAQLEPMYLELVAALNLEPRYALPARSDLVEQVKRFVEVVLGHLGVEENYILPVATDFLSAQDWAEMQAVHGGHAA